jgi:hypothetical protein
MFLELTSIRIRRSGRIVYCIKFGLKTVRMYRFTGISISRILLVLRDCPFTLFLSKYSMPWYVSCSWHGCGGEGRDK